MTQPGFRSPNGGKLRGGSGLVRMQIFPQSRFGFGFLIAQKIESIEILKGGALGKNL